MRIRLTKVLRVVYTGEILSEYRIGHNSLSTSRAAVHLVNLEKIIKKNKNLLKDIPPEHRNYVQQRADDFLGQMAIRAMRQSLKGRGCENSRFTALKYYLKALKYQKDSFDHEFALKLLLPSRYHEVLEFCGWDEEIGIGPEEGPYPDWNLPFVRWGLGPRTELRFKSKKERALLSMICGTHHLSWQNMEIILNGVPIYRHRFATPGRFFEIRIPLETIAGKNVIVFKYQTWDVDNPDKPLALLFKQLHIVSIRKTITNAIVAE